MAVPLVSYSYFALKNELASEAIPDVRSADLI
jgi:hypothetical protein